MRASAGEELAAAQAGAARALGEATAAARAGLEEQLEAALEQVSALRASAEHQSPARCQVPAFGVRSMQPAAVSVGRRAARARVAQVLRCASAGTQGWQESGLQAG